PWETGGRVLWETPVDGLRVGGSWLLLKFETTVLYPMPPPLMAEIMVYAGIGSIEYNAHDLLLTAEYAQTRFDINTHWIVKLEAHFNHGTARIMGTAMSRAMAPENWGLFLIKTTAYF